MKTTVSPGLYRHFKRGEHYLVLGCGYDAISDEKIVVYKNLKKDEYYSRPIESFTEIMTLQSGQQVSRFEPVDQYRSLLVTGDFEFEIASPGDAIIFKTSLHPKKLEPIAKMIRDKLKSFTCLFVHSAMDVNIKKKD